MTIIKTTKTIVFSSILASCFCNVAFANSQPEMRPIEASDNNSETHILEINGDNSPEYKSTTKISSIRDTYHDKVTYSLNLKEQKYCRKYEASDPTLYKLKNARFTEPSTQCLNIQEREIDIAEHLVSVFNNERRLAVNTNRVDLLKDSGLILSVLTDATTGAHKIVASKALKP